MAEPEIIIEEILRPTRQWSHEVIEDTVAQNKKHLQNYEDYVEKAIAAKEPDNFCPLTKYAFFTMKAMVQANKLQHEKMELEIEVANTLRKLSSTIKDQLEKRKRLNGRFCQATSEHAIHAREIRGYIETQIMEETMANHRLQQQLRPLDLSTRFGQQDQYAAATAPSQQGECPTI